MTNSVKVVFKNFENNVIPKMPRNEKIDKFGIKISTYIVKRHPKECTNVCVALQGLQIN